MSSSTPTGATTRRRKFSVDALFSDTSARAAGVSELVDAKLIELSRIEADPNQPRREFDQEALEELAASIRAEGVLQPIAVRYDEARDVYVVLHGERRWRASKLAGLEHIPAIVRDVPEDRRLIQQLMENIVREDLNALDRAAALRALKVQMGDASWERVAEAVGIRRSRLFQLLGTEKLSDSMQEALRRGAVSEKQTRAVQSLPDDVQEDLGHQLLAGNLDPRDLGSAAAAVRPDPRPAQRRQVSTDPLIRTARRHAHGLSSALQQIEHAGADDLDTDAATQLAHDLRELQRRIDEALASLGLDR